MPSLFLGFTISSHFILAILSILPLILIIKKLTNIDRRELRKRYWEHALPIIQEKHEYRGTFSNCSPGPYRTESGYFGLTGFKINCTINNDCARVDFLLGRSKAEDNKAAYDLLNSHKDEIEDELGIS